MLQLDQMKVELTNMQDTMKEVVSGLGLTEKQKRIEELSREMEEPDFWDVPEKANKKTKELKDLQDTVDAAKSLQSQYEDILGLIEMGNEEGEEDKELAVEIWFWLASFI